MAKKVAKKASQKVSKTAISAKKMIHKIAPKADILDSDLADDVEKVTKDYFKISNNNYCNSAECFKENAESIGRLFTKFGENFRNSLNNQAQFGMKVLGCTTIVDFIDLYQQNFKDRYNAYLKYSDDMFKFYRQLSSNNFKHSAECAEKSVVNHL